jgi:hypothetical protein
MQPIDESVLRIAIRQCLETADHYIRQGNRRDAQFYLDTADAYANRLIFLPYGERADRCEVAAACPSAAPAQPRRSQWLEPADKPSG